MAESILDAGKAREEIFGNVDGKRSRKQVIRLSVEGLLDKSELKDKSPTSKYNNVCSMLGGVLDALIRDGYIKQDAENATLSLCAIEDIPEGERGAEPIGKSGDNVKNRPAEPIATAAKPAKSKAQGKRAKEPAKANDDPVNRTRAAQAEDRSGGAKNGRGAALAKTALELANRDADTERKILDIVKKQKRTRREILTIIERDLDLQDKDEAKRLRTRAGQLLSNLAGAGKIVRDAKSGVFGLPQKDNKDCIHQLSGEEFNIHTQCMLFDWYKKFGNLKNIKSENTDGFGDNGVDCYIMGTDGMGFKEYIVVQSKHRAPGKDINIKDVREFVGIVAYHLFGEPKSGKIERPTKFIYSTNAKLTREAQKYVASLPFGHMLIILNGDEWLKKARECGYNI